MEYNCVMERKRFDNNNFNNNYNNNNYYNYNFDFNDNGNGDEFSFPICINNKIKTKYINNEIKSPETPKNYIEHRVSKFDTLAGVAIKYGVEVADIKKMNGLVTDLQMFALKSLQIPLPGRHPPSPILANSLDGQGPDSPEQTPRLRRHSDLFDSFQVLKPKSAAQVVPPAMGSLQGYYGIKAAEKKSASEAFEMAVYRKGGSHCLEEPFAESSPFSNAPLSLNRKSKSVANGLFSENGYRNVAGTAFGEGGSEKWNDKFIRRRQKSELDLISPTPELLMEDNSSNGTGFSTITGKGLALRPKSASRTTSGIDAEFEKLNPVCIGMGDSVVLENSNGVRKSSSTSSLQDQESCVSSISSIWPTAKWSLKPDLQALSTAAITRPIFDGLPKPITGRKNKAALD